MRNTYQSHLNELLKQTNSLNYYETKALPQAELILENANKGFTSGAINYLEFIQSESQALEIKFNYLKTLNAFNQAVIHLEYLINK